MGFRFGKNGFAAFFTKLETFKWLHHSCSDHWKQKNQLRKNKILRN